LRDKQEVRNQQLVISLHMQSKAVVRSGHSRAGNGLGQWNEITLLERGSNHNEPHKSMDKMGITGGKSSHPLPESRGKEPRGILKKAASSSMTPGVSPETKAVRGSPRDNLKFNLTLGHMHHPKGN
jgi:hypothetical protein